MMDKTFAVDMYRVGDSLNNGGATWVVRLPDGTFLDTSGSTSQGLQESIDFAQRHGFRHNLHGGGIKPAQWPLPFTPWTGQDPAIIMCDEPITFAPMQGGRFDWGSVTINFTGAVTSGAAMIFDSMMAADFQFCGGQIVAPTYDIVVHVKPSNELPYDSQGPVVTQSRFWLPSTVAGAGKTCIRLDTINAPIRGMEFRFIEPNAGAYGVYVAGANGFSENHIAVMGAHAQTAVSIEVGGGATGGATVYGNIWDVTTAPATGATGFDQWGHGDIIRLAVTNHEGTPNRGITFEAGAINNEVTAPILQATTPVLDASGGVNKMHRGV